ncbi:MAG: hypothetical protein IKB23_04695, partial [Clostridia bacterium]|nr:hypothetical protein [Clostridia bacterium]
YLSEIDSEDHAVTYVVALSRKVGTKLSSFGFNFQVSESSTGKEYGASRIFSVNTNGDVYLCGDTSKKISYLPEDGSMVTITIVVDFDGPNNDSAKATFTAYDTNGNKINEAEVGVTNGLAINDGILTMYEWSKWLSTYQAWFICEQDWNTPDPTAICIHKVYAIESDVITNPLENLE